MNPRIMTHNPLIVQTLRVERENVPEIQTNMKYIEKSPTQPQNPTNDEENRLVVEAPFDKLRERLLLSVAELVEATKFDNYTILYKSFTQCVGHRLHAVRCNQNRFSAPPLIREARGDHPEAR